MRKREEIDEERLDPRYEPISAWGYVGYQILFAIPVIGWLFLIIFACSNSNINRRSFARSYFCVLVIVLLLGGLIALVGWAFGGLDYLQGLLQQFLPAGA